MVNAHLGIGAGIARIAAQNLEEVVGGIHERIVELQVAKTYEETFLSVLDFCGAFGPVHNFGKRGAGVVMDWRVGIHQFALFVVQGHRKVGILLIFAGVDNLYERFLRGDGSTLAVNYLAGVAEFHLEAAAATGYVHS